MTTSDDLLNQVASAIYGAQLNAAQEEVKKIPVDAKDLPELFARLRTESETAQILIFSSYLEEKICSLIKSHLHYLTKSKEDELFGSNGPLSSFGNRLSLSYHLGWLSPRQKEKLDAFRKIRNEFAHRAFMVSMSDEKIRNLFRVIDYDVRKFLGPIRAIFESSGESSKFISDDEIDFRQENVCNLVLLTMNTIVDYYILPVALAYRVNPNDLGKAFGTDNNPVMELNRSISRVILGLLKKPDATFEKAAKTDDD